MSNPVDIVKVGNGLYSWLVADSTFNTALGGTALISGRVRNTIAEDNITAPYAVFSLISDTFWDTFSQEGVQLRVQITCYDEQDSGPASVTALGDKLRDRLHRAAISISGHEPMTVEFDIARGPFREDEMWRYDQDYMIRVFRT